MKKLFFCLIILTISFAACNDTKQPGDKAKEFTKIETDTPTFVNLATTTDIEKLLCQNWENKEDAEDAAAVGGSLEMPYRGFSFFSDGSFTENPRDDIRFGKWTLNNDAKMIDLEYKNGSKGHQKIGAVGPKQMVLLNMADKNKTAYRADGMAQEKMEDDPFYPPNNQWRIRPAKLESDSALKLRTKQAVSFYSKFLFYNAGRGGNIISFAGLPTCFKWYQGGLSIVNKKKLKDKWKKCFYNEEQAIKSQQLLENIISKKYKWNKEEPNWVRQTASVMRQINDTLSYYAK